MASRVEAETGVEAEAGPKPCHWRRRRTGGMSRLALKVIGGIGGAVATTYLGVSYYAIWDAESKVSDIEGELKEAGKALASTEFQIEANAKAIVKAEAAASTLKTKLAAAEKEAARIKAEIKDSGRRYAEIVARLDAERKRTSVLARHRSEWARHKTAAEVALVAARKQALDARKEMDPLKPLYSQKWL